MIRMPAILLPALMLLTPCSSAPTSSSGMILARPTLPTSSLPAPDPSTSLKYIALGVGTQNYTCATSDNSSIPVSMGAKANLFDATTRMSAPLIGDHEINTQPCLADQTNSGLGQRQLGVHYFNLALAPQFDLTIGTKTPKDPLGLYLSAKKDALAPAANNSCTGRNGAAAVPWLMLDDRLDGLSRGLSRVYRVHTAGGSAPANCEGLASTFTVDYAAEYWFYG